MHTRLNIPNARHQIGRRVSALPETHQRLSEMLVGVHWNVAGDVVENVGLGQVIEVVGTADRNRGGKFAVAEAVEELKRGNVAADCLGLKSSERTQKAVDIFKPGNAIGIEAQRANALEKVLVRVALPARLHARVQAAPSLVVFVRVEVVGLRDVELTVALRFFYKGCLGCGQTTAYAPPQPSDNTTFSGVSQWIKPLTNSYTEGRRHNHVSAQEGQNHQPGPRRPAGGTFEEEHGRKGFYGKSAHLYHAHPPTGWIRFEGKLRPHCFDLNELRPSDLDDADGLPVAFLGNNDVRVSVSRRSRADAVLLPQRRRR